MADSVETVRPTELGLRSPALKALSRRRPSEPGTLSVDSMGVLSSAGDDGACTTKRLAEAQQHRHACARTEDRAAT